MSVIKKRFTGLLVFAAFITGVLAAVPSDVSAAGSTQVSLKIGIKTTESYTVSVPSATELTEAGASLLNDGLKVTSGQAFSVSRKVVVNVQGTEGSFVNPDKTASVPYELGEVKSGNLTALDDNGIVFDSEAIDNQTVFPIGIKVEETDIENVPPGEYSDILVFTASLEDA